MASRTDKIMQMVKDMNEKKLLAESERDMSNRPTAKITENVSRVESETTSNLDLTMNYVTEPPNLDLDQNNESCNLLSYNDLCIENQSFNNYSVISIPDYSDNLNNFIVNDESDCDFLNNFEENRFIVVDTTSDVGFQEDVPTQNQQIELNEIPIIFSEDVGLHQDDHNYYKISSLSEPDEMDANSYNPIPNTTIDDGTSMQSLQNNATNNENDKEQCCSNNDSKEIDPDYEPSSSDDGSEDESQSQTFHPQIEALPLPLPNHGTNNENNVAVQNKRKRRKRQHVNEEDWSVNRNKAAREKGKPYLGKMFKNGKWTYDLPKDERKIKERCQCKQKEKSKIQCNMVTDEERQKIFNKFWNMSWKEKKIYLDLFVIVQPTSRARDRKDETSSRRESSYLYFLEKNQEKVRVCKTMFLATMGIGERAIRNWKKASNTDEGEQNFNEIVGQEDPDSASILQSGCRKYQKLSEARNKKFRQSNEALATFLEALAKMESHYCRKNSSKQYLEPNWISKQDLYREYCRWCAEHDNIKTVSIAKFLNVFEENNLSIFKSKKDECDICVGHRTGNISEDIYAAHRQKKDEARSEKEEDKKSDKKLVFTMDLQCVLLCPKSNVSSLYYKTKLAVHNFTFFNLKTKDVHCYVWNESEGGLTANEFTSVICDFLFKQCPLPDDVDSIVLYSDGCTYQNRNAVLANGLTNLAKLLNITIEQKFLEKGHTQMEADSVHSQIERQIRKKIVNVPADYVTAIENARKKPKPYLVTYLNHTFFKNFERLKYFKSIRPGRKVGDPCVTDIRALKYNKNGLMYKLRFVEEYTHLPNRTLAVVEPTEIVNIPSLYKDKLKIKKRKYDDLQELKKTIPIDYHSFYDNLQWY